MRRIGSEGFGLLEVMIAGAILAGLAVASMTMFKTQTTAQKTVEKKYEVTVLAQQMRTILSKPQNCTETFLNINSSSGSVPKLKKFIGTAFQDMYPVNTNLPEGLQIKSYTLSKSFPSLASNETMLVITFLKGKGSLTDEMQKTIKLIVTESAGNITTCYATSSGTEIWAYTTSGKDIFFNGGSVAIGNADPQATLDVTGEIRVGNTNVACSAANEGAMRYNPDPAVKNMEFCNGTSWSVIGQGSGVISDTGYWKFPGGLMFQWGFDTSKNGDYSYHKFATTFPNKCFVTIVTTWGRGVRGTNGHNHVLNCTQFGFTATIEVIPTTAGAGWIAIGF